ncbi:MAG: cobyric acid synthase [Candidatus Omnitrophota bacterium]
MRAKTIMIQGTGSGVGKSVLTAALCRIFYQDGYKAAPFKAQNMALNSFVTLDGGEIGRAQAMQAQACCIEPMVDMNPILLKPSSDKKAQVIVRGKPLNDMSAKDYDNYKQHLKSIVLDSFNRLSKEYEIIVIEGAGSPAEINLKERDIVNMFIAKETKSPVILVGDIDKGGVFAWLWGTLGLLSSEEKKRVKALLINKFRGDIDILKPGLDFLEQKSKRKILGVIPYFRNIQLDEEDSLYFDKFKYRGTGVKVRILYLPHISNFTDFDALGREQSIDLKYIDTNKGELIDEDTDVLIIPGSKSVIEDFIYLKQAGYTKNIKELAKKKVNIIGICGGYQMLGKEIYDPCGSESSRKKNKSFGFAGYKHYLWFKQSYKAGKSKPY